jgi:hypothetical protein
MSRVTKDKDPHPIKMPKGERYSGVNHQDTGKQTGDVMNKRSSLAPEGNDADGGGHHGKHHRGHKHGRR